MKINLSRKTLTIATAAMVGLGSLGMSVTSFAQEATKAAYTPLSKAAFKANHQVEKNVRKAFAKENHFNSSDVRIVARNGAVSLEGTMPDSTQIQRATTIASAAKGVNSVNNALAIREVGH
jgi:osmotically-inducible protein OsmY